jgi:hypothetical protein
MKTMGYTAVCRGGFRPNWRRGCTGLSFPFVALVRQGRPLISDAGLGGSACAGGFAKVMQAGSDEEVRLLEVDAELLAWMCEHMPSPPTVVGTLPKGRPDANATA